MGKNRALMKINEIRSNHTWEHSSSNSILLRFQLTFLFKPPPPSPLLLLLPQFSFLPSQVFSSYSSSFLLLKLFYSLTKLSQQENPSTSYPLTLSNQPNRRKKSSSLTCLPPSGKLTLFSSAPSPYLAISPLCSSSSLPLKLSLKLPLTNSSSTPLPKNVRISSLAKHLSSPFKRCLYTSLTTHQQEPLLFTTCLHKIEKGLPPKNVPKVGKMLP